MHNAINAILFQCLWFSAILIGWEVAAVPALLMAYHVYLTKPSYLLNLFIPAFIFLGVLWDSFLIATGLFQITGHPGSLGNVPLWLICCWLGFSFSLGLSMGWWTNYPKLFIAACMLFAPLSYFAGMRFGVLSFELFVLPIVAMGWGVLGAAVLWGLPKAVGLKFEADKGVWQS